MSQVIYTSNPAKGPISHWQGDTFILKLTIRDGNNNAVDATLYDYKMQVRDEDGNLIFELTNVDFTGDASGNVTGVKDAATMDTVPCGVYYYDLQSLEKSNGYVETIMYGSLKVRKDITK